VASDRVDDRSVNDQFIDNNRQHGAAISNR